MESKLWLNKNSTLVRKNWNFLIMNHSVERPVDQRILSILKGVTLHTICLTPNIWYPLRHWVGHYGTFQLPFNLVF